MTSLETNLPTKPISINLEKRGVSVYI